MTTTSVTTFSFGITSIEPSALSTIVEVSAMSTTRPWTSSPIEIRSPIRIGWRIAIVTPATKLAITVRPAKPSTRPSTAVEASSPVARRLISVNWLRASAIPIRMMISETSRRMTLRRVRASREICAVSMLSAALTARPIRNRSTRKAMRNATTMVIAASTSFPCCCQKV